MFACVSVCVCLCVYVCVCVFVCVCVCVCVWVCVQLCVCEISCLCVSRKVTLERTPRYLSLPLYYSTTLSTNLSLLAPSPGGRSRPIEDRLPVMPLQNTMYASPSTILRVGLVAHILRVISRLIDRRQRHRSEITSPSAE